MKITYLGQSGFALTSNNSLLLIDPSRKDDGELDGSVLYCTHNHSDHTGGVGQFLRRNPGARMLCSSQVSSRFPEFRSRTDIVQPDTARSQGPWQLEFVQGQHGLRRGVMNLGVLVSDSQLVFGHPGDTVTLEPYYEKEIDILAVPIGGIFTASPTKILQELTRFKTYPRTVIPMHWLVRNPEKFCRQLSERFPEIQCRVPVKGKAVV
jgi:L-ascorbate metabolism protein UlaG (beta-lactamase superfamily)